MTCKSVEESLEKFRVYYPGTRCTVFSDCIVYKVSWGNGTKAAKKANEIIEHLGLDLVAIPGGMVSNNSFCVQSIYSSEL